MIDLETYEQSFPHAKLTRSPEGVLDVVLHTDGGSLVFNGKTHEEFGRLFYRVGQDLKATGSTCSGPRSWAPSAGSPSRAA